VKNKRSLKGFTLIELLVALALSALLLIAVLFVSGSMAQARSAIDSKRHTDLWPPATFEMLRWDLANADRLMTEQNRMVLEGFCSLHSSTFAPTHRPVQVEYLVKMVDSTPWLVRRQQNLDSNSNRNELLELVCCNVAKFEVIDAGPANSSGALLRTTSKTAQPVPRILKIRMVSSIASTFVVEKLLVVD